MNNDQLGLESNGNEHALAGTTMQDQSSGDGDQLASALSSGDMGDANFVVETTSKAPAKSTIALFLVLVVGAGSVYFMYRRTGPQSASAAASKETTEAKKTISTFLSGKESNIKAMESMLKNTQMVVQQFLAYPSVTQVPLSDLRTNPFRAKERTANNGGPQENLNDIAERRRREEERVSIRKAADGLQLQSIMFSDARKACMINNTLYREAQMIDGFTIEKINPSSVIVKNGPYRFELGLRR
jgi:hypothetical protein